MAKLVATGVAHQEGSFLSLQTTTVRTRDRSEVDSHSLRDPDQLPPAEIDHTIIALIQRNHGLSEAEAPKVVSQTLGFHALGRNLRTAIEARIAHLEKDGVIQVEKGFLRAINS